MRVPGLQGVDGMPHCETLKPSFLSGVGKLGARICGTALNIEEMYRDPFGATNGWPRLQNVPLLVGALLHCLLFDY